MNRQVDVLIVGGGLAGLSLARHLLLYSDKRVLLIDRRPLPPARQKVGEATVQVSGYYYSRVLQMEEHLLREHFLKYNLRFYWPSRRAAGAPAATGAGAGAETAAASPSGAERFEELSQSYIRGLSNIATYQLDRNVFEAELLRVNLLSPRFELHAPTEGLQIELDEGAAGAAVAPASTAATNATAAVDAGDPRRPDPAGSAGAGGHTFRFKSGGREISGRAAWVVDASGRARVLARRRGLVAQSPIRHGTTFCWVDGLVDIERLTDLDAPAVRKHRNRAALGHTPEFLATNHFCGEGYWFWTIPLHGKTSLGLVYDRSLVPREEVATPQKMIDWICRQYPLFARDLPRRKVVDWGGYTDFALDSSQTLSAARWAMCGEACRFSDPLYSPGGDLISIYNTLIADAIQTGDAAQLAGKVRLYEDLARAVYEAYVPSFAISYEVLGDQEVFTLRYVWELTVYFAFFVFPFINDLFTDRQFIPSFLRLFSRLGPTNRNLHTFLVGFYRWKKLHGAGRIEAAAQTAGRDRAPGAGAGQGAATAAGAGGGAPRFFDFYEFGHLRAAEACFYKVGLTALEARPVLAEQVENLEELARFIVAHGSAVVSGDPRALSAEFVAAIDLRRLVFDEAAIAARLAAIPAGAPPQAWRLQTACMQRFRDAALADAPQVPGDAPPVTAAMDAGATAGAEADIATAARSTGR